MRQFFVLHCRVAVHSGCEPLLREVPGSADHAAAFPPGACVQVPEDCPWVRRFES